MPLCPKKAWRKKSPGVPRAAALDLARAFTAQGIRFVVDGYDGEFIKNTLEKDRDTFLAHLDEGQKIYTQDNFEYPVKAGAEMHPIIKAIGDLKADPLALSDIAKHRKAASLIMDRVGFDN